MKNKYLTKYLCITLFSAMVVTGSVAVSAAEESELLLSEIVVEEAEIRTDQETQVTVNEKTVVVETSSVQKTEDKIIENNTNAVVSDAVVSEVETVLPDKESEAGMESSVLGGKTETEEVGSVPGETLETEDIPPVSEEVQPEEVPGGENTSDSEEVPGEGEVPSNPEEIPGEGEVPSNPEEIPGEGEVPSNPEEIPGEGEVPSNPEEIPGEGEVPSNPEEVPEAGEIPPSEEPGIDVVPPESGNEPDIDVVPPSSPGDEPDIEAVPPISGDEPDIEVVPPASDETPSNPEEGETSGNDVIPVPSPLPGDEDKDEEAEEEQAVDEEKVNGLIQQLNKLMLGALTVGDEGKVSALRAEYNSLTEKEKELVENYHLLISFEAKIEELKAEDSTDKFGSDVITQGGVVIPSTILTSTPVYYTSMVSNLHAGKEFYLDSLKKNYQITFSDDFTSVMEAIEREHKAKYKVQDNCDKRSDGQTSSADTLLARNWQDVIAIYIYEKSKEGYTNFHLSALCKEDLARIFEELNPIVRDKDDITRVTYADRHINYYIKTYNISKEDREILKKYVENDCKLLCATVTAAKGFVRQSVGDQVSEERVNVITAAYSLVGKVGYFWGGKSNSVGENPNWGTAEFVSSPGSNSTGTLRAYGLDCSGFVSWAVINGYQNSSLASSIGDGTTAQWLNAQVISEAQAQPGDLVFQRGPEAGENNHVGILCGQTEAGDWIAIHCSSSKNGVTVGEAYGASFRYIRQPSFYPSDQQLEEYNSLYGYTGADISNVYVTDNLTQILAQTSVAAGKEQFQSNTVAKDMFSDVADVVVFGDSPDMVGGFTEFVVE